MNKGLAVVITILLTIVLVVLTGLFVFAIKSNIFKNGFSFNFHTYSDKIVEKKEFKEVNDIEVDTDTSDVFVELSEDNKVVVELYSEKEMDYEINNDKDKLYIKFKNKNKTNFRLGKMSRIIVKIPAEFANDFKVGSFANLTLNVDISTGDVEADKLKKADIKVSTGDVKVNKVDDITIKATTGDIHLGENKNVNIETTTGDISIDKMEGQLNIKTNTGDIRIGTATLSEDSSITATTGDIKVDSLTGAYVEASSTTGSIKINNNDRKLEKTCTIKTTTGDIRVNQ